jgi:hypothetical protein
LYVCFPPYTLLRSKDGKTLVRCPEANPIAAAAAASAPGLGFMVYLGSLGQGLRVQIQALPGCCHRPQERAPYVEYRVRGLARNSICSYIIFIICYICHHPKPLAAPARPSNPVAQVAASCFRRPCWCRWHAPVPGPVARICRNSQESVPSYVLHDKCIVY